MDCKHITRLTLGNKIFLLSVLLFMINELGVSEVNIVFFKSYLNDLIAPIVLLTLTNFLLSLYVKSPYKFSKRQLIFFFLYLSIFFEYLLPKASNSYVADPNDLLAYSSGILLYHFLINKK